MKSTVLPPKLDRAVREIRAKFPGFEWWWPRTWEQAERMEQAERDRFDLVSNAWLDRLLDNRPATVGRPGTVRDFPGMPRSPKAPDFEAHARRWGGEMGTLINGQKPGADVRKGKEYFRIQALKHLRAGEKRCQWCWRKTGVEDLCWHPLSEFNKNVSRKGDGYNDYCKACQLEYGRHRTAVKAGDSSGEPPYQALVIYKSGTTISALRAQVQQEIAAAQAAEKKAEMTTPQPGVGTTSDESSGWHKPEVPFQPIEVPTEKIEAEIADVMSRPFARDEPGALLEIKVGNDGIVETTMAGDIPGAVGGLEIIDTLEVMDRTPRVRPEAPKDMTLATFFGWSGTSQHVAFFSSGNTVGHFTVFWNGHAWLVYGLQRAVIQNREMPSPEAGLAIELVVGMEPEMIVGTAVR